MRRITITLVMAVSLCVGVQAQRVQIWTFRRGTNYIPREKVFPDRFSCSGLKGNLCLQA